MGIGYSVDREKFEVTCWKRYATTHLFVGTKYLCKSGLILIELILSVHSGAGHQFAQDPTNLKNQAKFSSFPKKSFSDQVVT